MSRRRAEAGFSVLEALISMTLMLFVVLAMATMYEVNRSTYNQAEDKVDLQQNARLALTDISRALRMAGYFPENFAAGAALENPIHLGTESAISLFGDTDDDGTSDVVMFCRIGTTVRAIRAPTGVATAYTCVGGDVIAEGVTDLRFTYFDGNGTPVPTGTNATYELDNQSPGAIPDLTTMTARDSVRRVAITLTTQAEAAPGKLAASFTLSTVVDLRNAG